MKRLSFCRRCGFLAFGLMAALVVAGHLLMAHADERSMVVKSAGDISHQSGKLGKYKALVIGINDYQDPKISDLKNAVRDAEAIAETLETGYGFKVTRLLNRAASKAAIYNKLRALAANSAADDSVLIYFAGHGDIDRVYNDGWWIPADAKGGDALTYLDNTVVQKAMKNMKARHVLLISDSCYSGTLFGEGRDMPPVIDDQFYLTLYNEKSRWGMTSGNKTPVTDSGSEGHSVFIYQLLKELKQNKKPYLTTQEIYARIAPIVGNNSEQTPLCKPVKDAGDMGGGFIFVSAAPRRANAVGKAAAISDAIKYEEASLEDEGREIEAEKQRLAKEKEMLTKKKALAEERRRLEEERRRLEAEKAETERAAAKAVGDALTDLSTGMEFVFVQGGCYQMGDTFGDGYSNEKPVHEVCVSDFSIGKHEVTVGQFRKFVNDSKYRTEAEKGDGCYIWTGSTWDKQRDKSWRNPGFSQTDNHPVACVSWNDAQEFIKWQSRKSSKKYRLPTEAEWEYAARSGGKSEKYAGTSSESSLGSYAWHDANSASKTHPVGQKQPNGLGLYDMSGNVWEWVQDWYGSDYYKSSPQNNPEGPSEGSNRVSRGGSWGSNAGGCRAANRGDNTPDVRDAGLGIRLARTH